MHGRNLSSALMRSRVHNRNRDRGCESIRLALAVGVTPVPPKIGIPMEKDCLILKPASASRSSGEWNDDDFDVLANGEVIERIFKANAAPVGSPWMWTLAFGHHEDRTLTHGLRRDPRRGHGCVRQELATGVIHPKFDGGERPLR
jgi:hypothetical protein